jgi:hypothetical protein
MNVQSTRTSNPYCNQNQNSKGMDGGKNIQMIGFVPK